MSGLMKKGERYRHPSTRGTWRVRSAGEKFVTLDPSIPYLGVLRIPTQGFMSAGWELVSAPPPPEREGGLADG